MGKKPKLPCSRCGAERKKGRPCPPCALLADPDAKVAKADAKRERERKAAEAKAQLEAEEAERAARKAAKAKARSDLDPDAVREETRRLTDRLDAQTRLVSSGAAEPDALAGAREAGVAAVDCEGVRLSRTGRLTLVQIASRPNSNPKTGPGGDGEGGAENEPELLVFDVATEPRLLNDADAPLRKLLQDPSVEKLFFDCRKDSDALGHQFGVELKNVLDLQLLCVAAQRAKGKSCDWLPGLAAAVRNHLPRLHASAVAGLKESVRSRFSGGESELWERRPLDRDAIRYAALDVDLLLRLRAPLVAAVDEATLGRVRLLSEQRCAELRDAPADLASSPYAGGNAAKAPVEL